MPAETDPAIDIAAEITSDLPIAVIRGAEADLIVIDRGKARKEWFRIIFIVVFWLVWTPATIFVTTLAVKYNSLTLTIWCVFGYVGVVVAPLALLQFFGKETIEITDADVTLRSGLTPIGGRWRCDRDKLTRVTMETYDPYKKRESETVYTLNLFRKGTVLGRRRMLASLVHADLKDDLYKILVYLLEKRGYDFEAVNTYKRTG